MTFFSGPSDAYARFMGRFSTPLASAFADLGLEGVTPGLPVLDVGAGPGMLTGELVRRRQNRGRLRRRERVGSMCMWRRRPWGKRR